MLNVYVHTVSAIQCLFWRWHERRPRLSGRNEHGQASAEYALVLLGAAAIALLVAGWAAKSGLIGNLLDTILGKITSDAGGRRPPTTSPRP